jgi:YD repeat-containing protein
MEKVEYSSQQTANGTVQTKEVKDGEDNLKNRVTYQYNEQRQLIQEAILNKEGRPITIYKYGYDAQGNRTSRSVNSGSGVKLAETLYTYNNKSLVIKSETIDGAGKKISSTESQYDADNNLIKQQVKNANGEITTTINAVWENGHEVKNEQLGPDGKVQIRIAKEYGTDGELLKKSIENFQGESRQVVAYEYTLKPEKK